MFYVRVCAAVSIVAAMAGCATTRPDAGDVLRSTANPAWSLRMTQDEMVVAASPAGRTLRFAGSTGFLVGVGVDAVVNARYRDTIREALQGYDTNAIFATKLREQLTAALGEKLRDVAPMGSTAGYNSRAEAERAHYTALARQGLDTLLDLRVRYGLYGTQAELVAELDAQLISLPDGKTIWSNTFFAVPRPALASDRLGNPLGKKRSSESAPQFTVDEAAFARWTANGGERLRAAFAEAVDGATAALLNDLGLAHDAKGQLYLGKMALANEDFEVANAHLEEALKLDNTLTDARNANSINLAQAGQMDDALDVALGITQTQPDYAPAWYNLAWWYAVDMNDPAKAAPYYAQARQLGMPPDAKLDELIR